MTSSFSVLQVLPRFAVGGAEHLVALLAEGLLHQGIRIGVLTLYPPGGTKWEDKLQTIGVPIIYLNKGRGFHPSVISRVDREIRQFAPDIIHSHQSILRYILPSVWTQRLPLVHTMHNLAQYEADPAGKIERRLALHFGLQAVAISERVRDSLYDLYGMHQYPLIMNGTRLDEFYVDPAQRAIWRVANGFAPDAVLFVTAGRLNIQKQHDVLIKAFAQLSNQYQKAQLLIAGEGPLRDQLEKQAQDSNLADRVHFLGVRSDIPDILNAADVFVLSSQWEGNPLSVMEAMAAGKPIVATTVGGVPELIDDQSTGLLVPPGDIDALAHALQYFLANPQMIEQLGILALHKAKKDFSIDVTIDKYIHLYRERLGLGVTQAREGHTGDEPSNSHSPSRKYRV